MEDAAPLTILVVGGSGVFGRRLVAGLLRDTAFDVVAAGRDAAKLAELQSRFGEVLRPDGRPRLTTLRLDRASATSETLRASGAGVVVDAAGPFQASDYRLAEAAIAGGLHYLDLDDARDFVAGFGRLDSAAKAAGVVALTGVSTTPALTNAVVDALTSGWRRIDRIEIAIAPGNRAPRGLAVVRAILTYAGRPVRVFAEGDWRLPYGWGMLVRHRIAGLGSRWFSLVETPDLDILPQRHAVRQAALIRAGLELPLLHLGLWAASLLVRWRILASLAPHAPLFRRIAALFEGFGGDRGGMAVEVVGFDRDGAAARCSWSLLAEAGEGPVVPTLPVLAALRALAEGRLAEPGASPCVGQLALPAIESEALRYRIRCSGRHEAAPTAVFRRVLGEAFAALPEPLRVLHEPGWGLGATGLATVDGADSPLGRLIARIIGLPPTAASVPVRIDITPGRDGEWWTRDFGGRRFCSVLRAANRPGRLIERFGPLSFELLVETGPAGLTGLPVVAWRLGPLPLPASLRPISIARESLDAEGRFRFDVDMRLPLGLGRLVRYRGWLMPEAIQPPRRSIPKAFAVPKNRRPNASPPGSC